MERQVDEDNFRENAVRQMSEKRRARFEEDFNWAIVVSPVLAALTAWWALHGDRLMAPVAAFFVVLTCGLWGWKILKRAAAPSVPPSTKPGFAVNCFVYPWILVVFASYFGYQQGFSPSGPVYVMMVMFAVMWAVALLLVVRAPIAALGRLAPRQYVFILAVSLPVGAGTSFDLGWLYTVRFGVQTSSTHHVMSKDVRYHRRGGVDYVVTLDDDGLLSPPRPVSRALWATLAVGSSVRVAETRSPMGAWISVASR